MATRNEAQVRAEIAAERRTLADVLAALPAERWDEPTLCEGWRVRETVAHITMAFRYSVPRFVLGMIKARGRFNRMADQAARADADALTAEQLVASLRAGVDHPWKPPGGGYVGALSHDLIHGLDITVGLDLDRRPPPERVGLVLGSLKPGQLKFFGVDLSGVELRATDLDWSYGTGDPVSGRAQDLLLAACGRRLPPGRLAGVAADRFSAPT
jgi:uncharacterized protein (TIGR03083 family)